MKNEPFLIIEDGQYFEYEGNIYQSVRKQEFDEAIKIIYYITENNEHLIGSIFAYQHEIKILPKDEYPELYI